jgi:hypothetical protein
MGCRYCVDKPLIIEVTSALQNNTTDVALPYNGTCLDVPEILRSLYLKNKNKKSLQRNENKMNFFTQQNFGWRGCVHPKK